MPPTSPHVASDSTRLYLDDVPTPVVARVARRTPEALTLSQDLHFLRLRKGVRDAEGREAELASVSLAVHGDTPRLVLELRYKPSEPPPARDDAGDGLRRSRADAGSAYRPLGESRRPARRDETVPYVTESKPAPPPPRREDERAAAGEDEATGVVRTADADRDAVRSHAGVGRADLALRSSWAAWTRDALLGALRSALGWLERYLA